MEPENLVYSLEKSPNDKRQYRGLLLSNQLRMLLISDPEAEKSACAVSVRVGTMADPDRSLGLAHFLEHMLFMGSAKYPGSNEYSQFMSLNAGYDNAFTADLETNYYFEIAKEKYEEATDRLADFFKYAVLDPTCVEKQRQAVHQEYNLWLSDDNTRKWGMIHAMGSGQFGRFNIGSQESLNHPNILEDLRAFYDKYYSSNMINVVLLSNQPLDEIQTKAVKIFSEIKNKNVTVPTYDPEFLAKNLGKLIHIQTIKEEQTIQFFWPIENLRAKFKKHLDEYIVHIIGHQGQNSILQLLKERGLASGCSAYEHHVALTTMIVLEIQLTQQGYENYEEVYNLVMKYIANLEPDRQIYEEIKARNLLRFNYRDKMDASSYVSKLAEKMHYFPLQNVLNNIKIFQDFDQKAISQVIRSLSPQNALVFVSSANEIKDGQCQKWFKVNYRESPLPELTKDKQQPAKIASNPFLPVDCTIFSASGTSKPPEKLAPNIVYQQDNQFNVCKGGISINIYSNEDKIYQELYVNWLQSMLKTTSYPAECLGIQLQYTYTSFMSLTYYGFNDTIIKLIKGIPNQILKFFDHKEKAEGLFQIELESLIEDYENSLLEASNEVAEDLMTRVLDGEKNTTIQQDLQVLHQMGFEDFKKFCKKFWKSTKLEWVFVGNFKKEEILHLVSDFENKLSIKSPSNESKSCMKLQKSLSLQLIVPSADITTSGTIVYYQFDKHDYRNKIILQLIKVHAKEPFFNELRTNKQLAYYVGTRVKAYRGVLGIYFILVSSNTDPFTVQKQIKAFVDPHLRKIGNLTDDQLKTLKEAVFVDLSEPHHSLKDLFDFVDEQVYRRLYEFNRKDKAVIQKILDSITKQDLAQAIDRILKQSLNIYVVAQCHLEKYKEAQPTNILTFAEAKKSNHYHEDYLCEQVHLARVENFNLLKEVEKFHSIKRNQRRNHIINNDRSL